MKLQPKNWPSFQHYKNRKPVWIKLYCHLLNDYEYHMLPVASKAIAPLLWILASEYEDGIIDADPAKIAFRLHISKHDFESALKPLTTSGFFTDLDINNSSPHESCNAISMLQDASNTLASCSQVACLEKEKEKEIDKRREEKTYCAKNGFALFWDAFGYKKGKGGAEKSWNRINLTYDLLEKILEGARRENENRKLWISAGRTPKMAQGWLTERRWEDEHVETAAVVSRRQPKSFDQIREENNAQAIRAFNERMDRMEHGPADFSGRDAEAQRDISPASLGTGAGNLLRSALVVIK